MTHYLKPQNQELLKKTHLIFDVNFCIGITNHFLLNYRFFLLENLLLKSLEFQVLKNFTLNLNIDLAWPDEFKRKLRNLLNKVSFTVIISEVETIKSIGNSYNKISASKYDYVGLLRIDDDDLICSSYTRNIARISQSFFSSMPNKNSLFCYSSEGYLYFPDSKSYGPVNCYEFPLAIGIGYIGRVGKPLKFFGNHNEVFSNSENENGSDSFDLGIIERSWIYTKHKQSDSTTFNDYKFLMENFSIGECDYQTFNKFGISEKDIDVISNFIKNSPESNYFRDGGTKRIVKLWEIDVPLSTEKKGSEAYHQLLAKRRRLENEG